MQRNLIIIFIVLASVCHAQYKTLPDSAALWLLKSSFPYPQPPNYFNYFTKNFKEDTVINSINYIKVYSAFNNYNYYIGGYRSLTTGETYFVSTNDSIEYLLFDFSKTTGDTIFNLKYEDNNVYDFIVDSTDLVGISNHKLMYLSNINNPNPVPSIIWLEGVGNIAKGLSNQGCFVNVSHISWLVCFSYNDTIYYSGNFCNIDTGLLYNYGRCSIPPQSIQEEELLNKIKLYPNPVNNLLSIEELPLSKNSIHIINMLGREVYQTDITGQTQASIHLGHLKSGMYVLLIKNETGLMFKHKLLKE